MALAQARVKQAEAALRTAELNLSYTVIRAPSKGVVSRRTVEVGQLVDPARALLGLVATHDTWVVANFKEDQLRGLVPGAKATITVDALPGETAGRARRLAGRRHRQPLCPAASRQRLGQLREGGAARASAAAPRRQAAASRCAPACRPKSPSSPASDAMTRAPAPGNQGQITGSKVGITVATMAAALMSVLDISIVNVGLSDIRASFGTPLDQIAWVSTGYAMANITIIPMSGWLQRRFGIRRYLTWSILLFTASSMLCGLAWNLPALVIFRIIQGVGGGAIIPTSQATLFARYPPREAGMAGALFGLGAITGPLLGPTIGGLLIEHASWHWMFYVNVPIGLLAAYLAWTNIVEVGFVPDQRPIDTFGAALLAVGMVTLQYTLEEGNRDGWLESPLIAVLGAVAAVSLITFVVHVLDAPHPIVDLRVFKSGSYTAATALNALIGLVLFGGSFLYSLYCGTIMRYAAIDIGGVFLRGSWIQLFLLPLVGRSIGKVDSKKMIFFGLAMVTLSTVLNANLTAQADTFTMTLPIFVRAVGLSFCFVPLSVAALSGLTPNQRGNAAGLFNATRELGGSIGLAWMSTRLTVNAKAHLTYLSEYVNPYSPVAQDQLAAIKGAMTARTVDATAAAYGVLNGRLNAQALSLSFRDGFNLLAAMFAASLIIVFFLAKTDTSVDRTAAH